MINIYCDESCHLENDDINVMVIGGIIVPNAYKREVYEDIKKIKIKHEIPTHREIKWTKVSNSKLEYYIELINYFFNNELLNFRAVVIPDKSSLAHDQFNQTHDDFYYKMYYLTLRKLLDLDERLKVYIDIKDTNGQQKVTRLQNYLNNKARHDQISVIQQIRSHENSILQLADLLIGAISYKNRYLTTSDAKNKIANLVHEKVNKGILSTSYYDETKFNIFFFDRR